MINKRRNYFINKTLQSRFIFGFTLKVVLGFLASWYIVYYLVDKKLSEAIYRSHINIGSTGEIIGDILLKVNLVAVPILVLAAIVLGEVMLKKITGPLKKFKEALEDFGRADLSTKILKDAPSELSVSYNTMVTAFSKVFRSIKGKRDELDKVADELELIAGKKSISREEIKDIYRSISTSREKLEKEIAFFKV